MKNIIAILLLIGLATNLQAQQKPVYERSRADQVLSDRAAMAKSFFGVPGGATYNVPAFVPDSIKGKGLFYLVAPGDTALLIGGKRVSGDTTSLSNRINQKVSSSLINAANGVAPLDAGGKVPFANLPASIMIYKGTWSAATNTPALTDGVGTSGWVYQASSSGTVDFGHGDITFTEGDYIGYNGSIWQWSPGTSAVRSVNGYQGIVNLVTDDIAEGNTNKYYTDTRVQTYGDTRYARLGTTNNITGIQRFNYGGTEVYIGPPDGGNNVISTSGTVSFGAANIGYIQGQDFVNSVFTKYNVGPGGIEFIRPLTQTYPTFRLITTNGTDANPEVSFSFGYNLTSNPGYSEDVLQYSARNLYWKGSQVATYSDLTGYYNWATAANPQGRVLYTGPTGFPTSSANFNWNDVNGRLGIGSSTAPAAPLHVFGNESRLDGTLPFYSLYDGGSRAGFIQGVILSGTPTLRINSETNGNIDFRQSGAVIGRFNMNSFLFGSVSSPVSLIQAGRSRNVTALSNTTGRNLYFLTNTLTDSTSSASAIIANANINYFAPTTIAATNPGVTYTNLSTLTLAAPVAGTNLTITNPYSLWALGAARFDARIDAFGATEQLRLLYNSSSYVSHTVSSGGNYTISPTGGSTIITGALSASASITSASGLFSTPTTTNPVTVLTLAVTGNNGVSRGPNINFNVPTSGSSSQLGGSISVLEPAASAADTYMSLKTAVSNSLVEGLRITGTNVGVNTLTNLSSSLNSQLQLSTTGAIISRDIADANSTLTINKINASSTGDILRAQFGGTTLASINYQGYLKAVAPFYSSGTAYASIYNTTNDRFETSSITITQLNNLSIATGNTGTGNLVFANTPTLITPKLTGYTVATLPAGIIGMLALVTDASSPTYLSTVSGGGSAKALVMYDGTAWIVH